MQLQFPPLLGAVNAQEQSGQNGSEWDQCDNNAWYANGQQNGTMFIGALSKSKRSIAGETLKDVHPSVDSETDQEFHMPIKKKMANKMLLPRAQITTTKTSAAAKN